MKTTLRLPTSDQYAFIEIETEVGSVEDAVHQYNQGMAALRPTEGLPPKEWNSALDRYLQDQGMDPDVHARMGKAQQWLIHEIDKSSSRMAAKENKQEIN